MVSGGVTVPSVNGQNFNFTVQSTNTLAYAGHFANAVEAAIASGSLEYLNLSQPGDSIPGYTPSGTPTLIEQEISDPGSYALSDTMGGGVYTFVSANGSTTITGSGVGDTLLVQGASPAVTYVDVGGNNAITFADGNNTYIGDLSSSGGTNTIVAGSGNDTITTGAGHALVYSGAGHATITLSDTLPGGATSNPKSIDPNDYSQFAYLDSGTNTVYASGATDVIVSTAPGQSIVGGAAGQTDLVALVAPGADHNGAAPTDSGIPAGNDTVNANAAHVSVYDATDGNSLQGGTGALVVLFADSVQAYVSAGSGANDIYGNAGDTISYSSGATQAGIYVLGTGAESVDASGAAGQLTFVLGTGNDTLTAGANTNFNANYDSMTGLTGTITINDFAAGDTFDFVGYSADQYEAALATGTQTAGGYQITLSDNTKVTFVGLSSLSGHTANS